MNRELWLKILKLIMRILDFILDEAEESGQGTGDIQKALFPMEYLRITADETFDTHKGGYAIDLGGKDTGKDMFFAPCDIEIKRIRPGANGEVYAESIEPVKFADGTTDYLRILTLHDDTAEQRLNVGDIIVQGDWYYSEGGMGGGDKECFAPHIHMEVGKGKWENNGDTKHHQMANGNFAIKNPAKIEDIFFIPKTTKVIDGKNKNFKYL